MRNANGSGKRPKKNEIICYATAMVLSILFISLTQRQKSSAYDSNLAQAILKRQWNSFSLTYSLTISTKLSLYLLQKEEYLNHVYGYDAVFSQGAVFFSFLANVILASL